MSDLRRDSGFGMLEVIFVVIVMSMAAIAITKMTSDTTKMTAFVSGKNSRENVIQTVLLNTDCAASFPSVPGCSDGQYVNLVSKVGSGAFVIRADGTSKLSGYSVRARCVYQPAASNYGLDIRVAQLSSPAVAGDPRLNFGHANGTSFRREEVSGLSLSWSHPKAALFSAPSDAPCAAAIGGTTANLTCKGSEVQLGIKPNGLPHCGPVPTPSPGAGPASCQVVGQNWYRGNVIYTPLGGSPAVKPSSCPAGSSLVSKVIVDQKAQSFSKNSPQAGYSSWTETLFLRGLLCCK